MSHSNLTHWIEDADARAICRDAAFLAGVEQKQYLHLGTMIAKVAEWWNPTSPKTCCRCTTSQAPISPVTLARNCRVARRQRLEQRPVADRAARAACSRGGRVAVGPSTKEAVHAEQD
jgi:hypothetical protein